MKAELAFLNKIKINKVVNLIKYIKNIGSDNMER
mgnify:CR=1 FL=1